MDGVMQCTTKAQRGSPSRDRFKHLHKQMLPKEAWALDVDLELVTKVLPSRLSWRGLISSCRTFDRLHWGVELPELPGLAEPHAVPVYIVGV